MIPTPRSPRTGAALLAAAAVLVAGCSKEAPRERVLRARRQFEVSVEQSVPDTGSGQLIVEALVKKNGKVPLDRLTLLVEQQARDKRVLREDHVTVDVSALRPYEGKEVSFRVPLSPGEVYGIVLDVEPTPRPDVSYPELEGLPEES